MNFMNLIMKALIDIYIFYKMTTPTEHLVYSKWLKWGLELVGEWYSNDRWNEICIRLLLVIVNLSLLAWVTLWLQKYAKLFKKSIVCQHLKNMNPLPNIQLLYKFLATNLFYRNSSSLVNISYHNYDSVCNWFLIPEAFVLSSDSSLHCYYINSFIF